MEDIRTLVSRYSKISNGTRAWQRATGLGSLAVAEVELSRTELARAGRYIHGGAQIIANMVAPVQAIPTTTPQIGLYNGNANDSLCIDYVTGPILGSGTAAAGNGMYIGFSTQTSAGTIPVANTTGWTSVSGGGSTSRRSLTFWNTGVTFTAAQTSWIQVSGGGLLLAAANVGQGIPTVTYYNGSIIVPPGYNVGFCVLGGAGTSPLYGHSVGWAEVPLDIE